MGNARPPQTSLPGVVKVIRALLFLAIFISLPAILLNQVMKADQPGGHGLPLQQDHAITSENRIISNPGAGSEQYPFLTAFLKLTGFVSSVFSDRSETKNSVAVQLENDAGRATATDPSRHKNSDYGILINRSPQGSFLLEGLINKTGVIFVVDTGASFVVIPSAIAKASGLSPGRALQTTTASDVYTVYDTIVPELRLGNITLEHIHAVINPRAPDDQVLLGMTALQYLTVHQENGQIMLSPPQGASPAYKRSVQECNDSGSDQIIINERVLACMRGF
jgi:aspartyl protease family protein